MKKILTILSIVFLFGCTITTGSFYDDMYYSRPSVPLGLQPYYYNPMFFNRYTPYRPYYFEPRYYVVPRQNNQPRITQPYKQPQPQIKHNNAPIRRFEKKNRR